MALRVLNYITNFYMDYKESNPQLKMLPAIFPNGLRLHLSQK